MEALKFTGSGSEYFKIWIVNILLTIITLGIYHPWAKVRNRRYFYGNTNLAERNFEYHATGKQLLLGFIIGVIVFAIYTFVTQIAPQFAIVFILLFMLIFPWLIWRSLIFNMKVTSFSNVHFSFKGALKTAYAIFLGYPLLAYLIIGVAVAIIVSALKPILESINPDILIIGGIVFALLVLFGYIYIIAFINKKSKEYFIGNSYYGQGKFSTNLELKKFFIITLKSFGLLLVLLFGFVLITSVLGMGIDQLAALKPENMEKGGLPIGAIIALFITYFVMIFSMLIVMAYGMTRQRTYVYENSTLDEKISFKSTLRARDFIWVMFSNMFLVLITLGFASPWAKVRMARLMLTNTLVDTSVGFNEYITQQQDNSGAIGEQIGEAFDVDMDVGF